ncbi:hypothetical protein DVH05_021638 [Phytophthora capsici]|nr:hypothetical protein DVH05_021638 [Phytophthora capsici]
MDPEEFEMGVTENYLITNTRAKKLKHSRASRGLYKASLAMYKACNARVKAGWAPTRKEAFQKASGLFDSAMLAKKMEEACKRTTTTSRRCT